MDKNEIEAASQHLSIFLAGLVHMANPSPAEFREIIKRDCCMLADDIEASEGGT